MWRMFIFSFFALSGTCAEKTVGNKPWLHLELGASNYGPDPLAGAYASQNLSALQNTVEDLAFAHPEGVIIYINDENSRYVAHTIEEIKRYSEANGITNVSFVPVPGDFLATAFPRVNSVNLKNPEPVFIGPHYHSDDPEAVNKNLRTWLSRSNTGLIIETWYEKDIEAILKQPNCPFEIELLGVAPNYVKVGDTPDTPSTVRRYHVRLKDNPQPKPPWVFRYLHLKNPHLFHGSCVGFLK